MAEALFLGRVRHFVGVLSHYRHSGIGPSMVFDNSWIRHGTACLHGYATSHSALSDIPMLRVGAMR